MGTWEEDHPQTIIYYKDENFIISNGGNLLWYYLDVETDDDLLYDNEELEDDIFLMELNLDWRNAEEDLEYIENIQVL